MSADGAARSPRDALAPLPAGYVQLFDHVLEAVRRDPRIRALWLGGSLARGDADAGSDLDLILTVRDDALDWFVDNWRQWIEPVAALLLARPLPGHPGSFFATTQDCLRLDVIVECSSELQETPYRYRLPVLDRDGLVGYLPEPSSPAGPSAGEIAAIVEEFYRQQVIFPAAVVARADWLLGVVGVHSTHLLLYQLFVATNAPSPPMGVKQWSRRLNAAQRHVLADLPSPQANRKSVVSAMQAVRTAFRTSGHDAVLALNLHWPDDVDATVSRYWAAEGL
jgi:predicted nucleotidyltransferase